MDKEQEESTTETKPQKKRGVPSGDNVRDTTPPEALKREKQSSKSALEMAEAESLGAPPDEDVESSFLSNKGLRNLLIGFNVVSLVVSIVAFMYAIQANQIQKAQITTEMATIMGKSEVTDALVAARKALELPPVSREQYAKFQTEVQPLKRVLEALGICVELGVCNSEYVVKFACDEAVVLQKASSLAAVEAKADEFETNDFQGLIGYC